MKLPVIGKTESGKDLSIDIQRLLVSRMLIQASSGGGKSFAMRRILEQTANHVQQVILDIEGEFATLREKHDYILCAPKGADVVANVQTATILARHLRETRASAVIDLYELAMQDRKKFVRLFLEEFVESPKSLWHPCIVVVDEAHHFCLSADTEILTKEGFKLYDEIVPEITEAVCFDTKSGDYSYGPVQRLIVREHDGEMIHLKSDGLDSLSTPDHRVVLKRVQRAVGRYKLYDWTFCQADKVPTCVGIPLGGAPIGDGISELGLKDARILGWIITDGYWCGRSIGIEQSHATVKCGRSVANDMDAILATIEGVNRYDRAARVTSSGGRDRNHAPTWSWYFSGSSSKPYLRWLGEELHRVPRYLIENASRGQLEALYLGLLEGDGTAPNGKWVNFYPGHSGGLADDFQEIAMRLGISTTKHFEKSINQWHVRIANERSMHWVRRPEKTSYCGVVWDVTVPTGAFVARRNGRVFVTGNCPEKGEAESMAAVNDLITRGRKRGLCGILATQRLSKLNKDSAAELHNKLIGLAVLDTDVKRAADDLGLTTKEAMAALRALDPGEFFAVGPALTRTVTKIKVGPVETTHPEAGAGAVMAPPPPSSKIKALLAKLTDLPTEAAQEARTLADYKRELINLKRELTLTKKEQPHQPATEIKTIEKPVVGQKAIKGIEAADTAMRKNLKKMYELKSMIEASLAGYQQVADKLLIEIDKVQKAQAVIQTARPVVQPAPVRVSTGGNGSALPGPQQRIVDAIAWLESIGVTEPEQTAVAFLAGYTVGGGAFNNPRGALRTAGMIDYRGTRLALTEEGRKYANTPDAPLTSGAMHQRVLERLPGPERKLLQAVIEAWPDPLTDEELAERTGYSVGGGAFNNPKGRLRTLGLVSYPAPKTVIASEILFP